MPFSKGTVSNMNSASQETETPVILVSPLLKQTGVRHGFTTRLGGFSTGAWRNLNLSMNVGDSEASVAENRKRLARYAGFALDSLVGLSQIHGREVLQVDDLQDIPPEHERLYDASISNQPGMILSVRIADCVPILIASVKPAAACAIHAGWRGTLQDVAGAAIERLHDAYGCQPAGLFAAIGPCIHACCYTVDAEVFERFRERFGQKAISGECDVLRVNLVDANHMLLEKAGIPSTQIDVLDLCTSCREDLFFSHRRDRGLTGRQMAFIELR